jgi:8-oxo-dGTP pyrophosphatase MutT (NUDIX family)
VPRLVSRALWPDLTQTCEPVRRQVDWDVYAATPRTRIPGLSRRELSRPGIRPRAISGRSRGMTLNSEGIETWYRRLPGVTSAVGALIRDRYGRVLLAEPTYKAQWVMVGGTVGTLERPTDALQREISEELGLALPLPVEIGRLLTTDWVPTQPGWDRPMHHLVFDCGTLSEHVFGTCQLPQGELRQIRFVTVAEARGLMASHEASRLANAVRASECHSHYYLEAGRKPACESSTLHGSGCG